MALHAAFNRGRSAKVGKVILDIHDLNAYDDSGRTPLLRAAYHGNVDVARELIRAKADVHLKARGSGRTALHVAAYYGDQALVKLFLETNIGINEQDERGKTALMLAVQRRHSAVVAELAKAGADCRIQDREGMTAILLADRYDVVRPLVNDIHSLSKEELNHIFWCACEGGDLRMVQSALGLGCDVNHIFKATTPLMIATLRGHDGIVKELILAGCKVNTQSHVYYTDMDSSVNMAVVLWPQVAAWLAMLVAALSPVTLGLSTDPDMGSVVGSVPAILALCVALLGSLFVPGSGAGALLGAGVTGIAMAFLVTVTAASGPVAWTVSMVMSGVANFIVQGPSVTVVMVGRGLGFVVLMISMVELRKMTQAGYYITAISIVVFVAFVVIYVAEDVALSVAEKGIAAATFEKTVELVEVIAVIVLAVAAVSVTVQWVGFAGITGLYPILMCVMAIFTLTSAKASKASALHYAAGHNRIKCGVILVEGGADMLAKNTRLYTPCNTALESFANVVNQTWFFSTRKIIAVIGNGEVGKSTLIAALESESNFLCMKLINYFRKVHDIRQRTAGIEAIKLSSQRYGEALFYDFAGQPEYHGPHQSFLEAMLSKPGVSVAILLLVKATEEENIITQQLFRWLQPLALTSTPSTPQVFVIGSHVDKVTVKKAAYEKLLRCTQSVQKDLLLNIEAPCLLDCRRPVCKGINQLCTFLKHLGPSQLNTSTLSYNLHWVMVQTRKMFSVSAVQLHEFTTWLQDNAENLPKNLPSPEEVCQDLSAAGHALFLHNKQDPSQSWLILHLPSILHDVYGTLFSGSQGNVNEFGLLHCSQLAELFPKLQQAMIQEVLISLEFCIQIDPLLLTDELSKLTADKGMEGWLYFPALVSAKPQEVFPEGPNPDQLQWICWQLRTGAKFFISARLLQTIILRLAANHVFTHELSPSVKQHCCSVWVNGIKWSSTKGVDVAVQISDSSVVQVVGRSKAGSQRLQEYTAVIVQDVIKTIAQLSSKLEATPYIIHPYTSTLWVDPMAAQPDTVYPVSSIINCISSGDDHIPSLSPNTSSIPIGQLFGGESPSLSTVQCLNFPRVTSDGELTHNLMRWN